MRRVIHLMLRRNGYRVLSAPDGDMALTLCRQHNGALHLLVTDLDMPNMGGSRVGPTGSSNITQTSKSSIYQVTWNRRPHSSDESPFCFSFSEQTFPICGLAQQGARSIGHVILHERQSILTSKSEHIRPSSEASFSWA